MQFLIERAHLPAGGWGLVITYLLTLQCENHAGEHVAAGWAAMLVSLVTGCCRDFFRRGGRR